MGLDDSSYDAYLIMSSNSTFRLAKFDFSVDFTGTKRECADAPGALLRA